MTSSELAWFMRPELAWFLPCLIEQTSNKTFVTLVIGTRIFFVVTGFSNWVGRGGRWTVCTAVIM